MASNRGVVYLVPRQGRGTVDPLSEDAIPGRQGHSPRRHPEGRRHEYLAAKLKPFASKKSAFDAKVAIGGDSCRRHLPAGKRFGRMGRGASTLTAA